MQSRIAQAAKAVRHAEAILVTAGAGIGVDSGLPDFRGNEGFWKAYPPMARLGLSFSECADPAHFIENPHFAWGFYGHRLNLYRSTSPHAGFEVLRELCKGVEHGGFVFTSNVDGQFHKAEFDADRIVECHGSIHHLQGVRGGSNIWKADAVEVDVDHGTFLAKDPLPMVEGTGELARPNILMFGDFYWVSTRTDAQYSRYVEWIKGLQKKEVKKVVVFDIGSGEAVPTARNMAERVTRLFDDGVLIRINPRHSGLNGCAGFSFDEGSLTVLEALATEI